jgi:hypothetical protein
MAWLEYSLTTATPIVKSLRADAVTPATQLRNIAMRLGVPYPRMANDYFKMALPLSDLLQQIELGSFNTNPGALFVDPIASNLRTIISHWSAATGRDLSAPRTQLTRSA